MNAIEVHNVSKKYILHREKPTLLKELFLRPFKRHETIEEFWALRDISFEIKKGETVGIIGENGAGKSTLLKILTGVTRPTSGTAKVNGGVRALLELGAGFHHELTGRENVYLNGVILGLSKSEIDQKFDEIVDFSGIGGFIDSPVRTYSSGMFVRLGFSIAVHTEPDVLIIDEILAVGDIVYRRKCKDKLNELKKKERTIILVSHNIKDLQQLCQKTIVMNKSKIIFEGNTNDAIELYVNKLSLHEKGGNLKNEISGLNYCSSHPVIIENVKISGKDGFEKNIFDTGDMMMIEVLYTLKEKIDSLFFRIQIFSSDKTFCFGDNTDRKRIKLNTEPGKGKISIEFMELRLLGGTYLISLEFSRDAYTPSEFMMHNTLHTLYVRSQEHEGGGIVSLPSKWDYCSIR